MIVDFMMLRHVVIRLRHTTCTIHTTHSSWDNYSCKKTKCQGINYFVYSIKIRIYYGDVRREGCALCDRNSQEQPAPFVESQDRRALLSGFVTILLSYIHGMRPRRRWGLKALFSFLLLHFPPAHCPVCQQGYNFCQWRMLSPPIHVDGNGQRTGVNRGK